VCPGKEMAPNSSSEPSCRTVATVRCSNVHCTDESVLSSFGGPLVAPDCLG
jgi:hypothetical protein